MGGRLWDVSEAELQFLRALADVRLPERWAALVASLPPRSDPAPGAIYLSRVERVTGSLGLPFTPAEYDDEDIWPASRADRYGDRKLVMRIYSPDTDSRPAHRLAFVLEVHPGTGRFGYRENRIERLVTRIRDELDRPDIGPVAEETWYQTYDDTYRAIAWFVELCRDLVGPDLDLAAS